VAESFHPPIAMNVTYRCPHCEKTVRTAFTAASTELSCPQCASQLRIPAQAVADNRLERCLVCPSTDLFARKDFPQKLGVGLVVFGFVASSIAWANYQVFWTFAILFATALVDLVLYLVMGESLTCYRCHAQYRGTQEIERHGGFNLETHERYRQLAARLQEHPTPAAST
jgi:DNA-directed RNA polymerase subunit RPC12/RpoP